MPTRVLLHGEEPPQHAIWTSCAHKASVLSEAGLDVAIGKIVRGRRSRTAYWHPQWASEFYDRMRHAGCIDARSTRAIAAAAANEETKAAIRMLIRNHDSVALKTLVDALAASTLG